MKKFVVTAAFIVFSMTAQANTYSESVQAKSIQEHQEAVAAYAVKNGKQVPEIQDYKYGMKIDVAKFVRRSQDPNNCKVYSRLMTYEDSHGELKTLRYSMAAQCINNK